MYPERKNVLVTGGAGFIGSHLAERLVELGNRVVVYDDFDDFYLGKERNLEHLNGNGNFQLVRGSILDFETLSSLVKRSDMVFHMAAQAGIRYCIDNPGKAHSVNATGTLNVLMAAKQAGTEKVVYASSSGIFGNTEYVPMDEKHPTNPNSPYGASKLAGEKYCLAFNEVYGLDVTCLRFFSVYGPRGRPDQVIHSMAAKIVNSEPPVIYGNGQQTRDFTYVSDVVESILLAASTDASSATVFNIGFGREVTINDVCRRILASLGREGISPIYKDTYKGEFPRTLADNTRAARVLGWRPKVDLDEGIRHFLAWLTKIQKQKSG